MQAASRTKFFLGSTHVKSNHDVFLNDLCISILNTKYTSRRMIFSPLNRFCIDDNITILFRMNPKMKTIKKQFRWTFVVLRHMWQEPAMWWWLGCVRTQESQQFNQQNKNKTFYLMSLYTQRTITQDLLYPEKCAILALG